MEILTAVKDNSLIFYLNDKIELYELEELINFILLKISEKKYKKIIFNFQNVTFLDSTILRLFINLHYIYKEKIQIYLCNLKENIKKAFDYTKLDSEINIIQNENECFFLT